MRRLGLALTSSLLGLVIGAGAQQASPKPKPKPMSMSMAMPMQQAPVEHEAGVPSFHRELPPAGVKALPPTLNPTKFADPRVQAAYAMAAKVRAVLYQQPCYCHCDQEVGHHSLLDCFAGDHASICETCMMEGVYAYQQTKAGKSPQQIRADIERGAWRNINLNDLLTPRKY